MTSHVKPWEQSFDQPGSADSRVIHLASLLALLIVVIALGVAVFGRISLPACPQFAVLYASFVFLLNSITFFILLILLRHRQLYAYAILACAFLFEALAMVPFILTFPGTVMDNIQILGGMQSAGWVSTSWHTLFPVLIATSLLVNRRLPEHQIPEPLIPLARALAAGTAFVLAALVLATTTFLADDLPDLQVDGPNTSSIATQVSTLISFLFTAIPVFYCWQVARRQRTVLHLWLAVTLLASLADTLVSVGTTTRYSLAWYFSRIETMIASSVLLLLFLNEISRLYHQLATAMNHLLTSNAKLSELVTEKDALLMSLKESEEHVRQLAYYDPLTNLPNRRLLLDRLEQAITHAKRNHASMAIMFMDLDHFKQINDTLGHDAGDKLLVEISTRMTDCMRKGDTASRSGGDEFIIILPEIAFPEDAALVAEKIIVALREPVTLGSHRIKITISIGIAVFPIDGEDDLRELLRKADQAMYAAKADGRDRLCFYSGIRSET